MPFFFFHSWVRMFGRTEGNTVQTETLPVSTFCPLHSRADDISPTVTRLLFYHFSNKDFRPTRQGEDINKPFLLTNHSELIWKNMVKASLLWKSAMDKDWLLSLQEVFLVVSIITSLSKKTKLNRSYDFSLPAPPGVGSHCGSTKAVQRLSIADEENFYFLILIYYE